MSQINFTIKTRKKMDKVFYVGDATEPSANGVMVEKSSRVRYVITVG